MKKIITLIALFAGLSFAGTLTNTTAEVQEVIDQEINQYGAGGYSAATNVTLVSGVWTDVPGAFTIPYVSGFSYVSGSTIEYNNGARWMLFQGSVALQSGASSVDVEVGLETNGVYVVGSSPGVRSFANSADKGSLSYAFPIYVTDGMQIGLVVKSTKNQTLTINGWQSVAIRF